MPTDHDNTPAAPTRPPPLAAGEYLDWRTARCFYYDTSPKKPPTLRQRVARWWRSVVRR